MTSANQTERSRRIRPYRARNPSFARPLPIRPRARLRLQRSRGACKSGSAKPGCRLAARGIAHADRQFVHLLIARTVPIPEVCALVHGEGNNPRRARIGANDQHIGFAVASRELAISAIPAQVSVAHGCAVLHIDLAHCDSFLNPEYRKLLLQACCQESAGELATRVRSLCFAVPGTSGLRPRPAK